MKILVIEDDAQAAAYLVKGLKESGHVVDHAADGKDGLFMAGSENYDVLIVDRMLPGCDGLAIVETLRGAGDRHAGPVPERAGRASTTGCGACGRAATTIWPSPTPSPNCWRGSKPWAGGNRRRR